MSLLYLKIDFNSISSRKQFYFPCIYNKNFYDQQFE